MKEFVPETIRWGILGPGSIARQFAKQLPSSQTGELVAVGSSDRTRAKDFAAEAGVPHAITGTYEEVLSSPDVDAVYVSTVNTSHAQLVLAALRAGKHVLCEKPLAPNHGSVMAIVDAARTAGVILIEAYMYRFHPQTVKLLELIRDGAIGQVQHIDASFCFDVPEKKGRLFDANLAGGGILDVGGYPVTMARAVAGAASGQPFVEPVDLQAAGYVGSTGVDEWAVAHVTFPANLTATLRAGIRLENPEEVTIFGSEGTLFLSDPWTIHGRQELVLRRVGEQPQKFTFASDNPANRAYALEADALAKAVATGQEPPEMSLDDTLGTSAVLERWRDQVGVRFPFEAEEANIPPVSGLPLAVMPDTPMRYSRIPRLDKPVSRLVMGCDNQPNLAHASSLFDVFWSSGGNTFDTAWMYGNDGENEKRFGKWLANRGVREEAVVIVKGAHTPHCDPDSLSRQLLESLERQGLEYADVYLMHRDNPDIPVGEFVDVLDEHAGAGRIRAFGGSNWTVERFDEANAWAAANGKRPLTVLSNYFGLAEAYDVPWAGCRAATDPESKRWLAERDVALLPWSSQARGFFARANPADLTDSDLVRCFYGDANFERKRRAEQLAKEFGVPATAVALAYVLAQQFPTFALVGPRSIAEYRSTMTGLGIELNEEQTSWLDLRNGQNSF
ncbi:putative dehydrogenase/aryl-alcohol dehydrogenase-like putative oxidoreductase [Arthrobacter pascens]|uniref:aldo/keto reductase n=1 Tax=Arthrobacter pascens TaxID=1677 RepID=UPI00277D2262|nr:aldo/keto reductase [Arthrobacter pascens]MDQ0632320.1 putative dehydrogenase/aryl-alcohol dehydrogenase-like putative oxidoreductase [Arthrobacter pascens]